MGFEPLAFQRLRHRCPRRQAGLAKGQKASRQPASVAAVTPSLGRPLSGRRLVAIVTPRPVYAGATHSHAGQDLPPPETAGLLDQPGGARARCGHSAVLRSCRILNCPAAGRHRHPIGCHSGICCGPLRGQNRTSRSGPALAAARGRIIEQQFDIEALRIGLAKLLPATVDRSSEKLRNEVEQLELDHCLHRRDAGRDGSARLACVCRGAASASKGPSAARSIASRYRYPCCSLRRPTCGAALRSLART
jgi:hypothetical protein